MMPFSSDYNSARESFIQTAEKVGFRLQRFRVPYEETSDLFIDLALLRRDPEKLLVHISGVHGVEGYAGSAIQNLICQEEFSAAGPSILFVHALNPYGMAFFRRNNGENVDLNRNSVDDRSTVINRDYHLFNSYLNPRSRFEFLCGLPLAAIQRLRIGSARTSQAVAAGQLENPQGLFYVGENLQREIAVVKNYLAGQKNVKKVFVLDAHTGLGIRGQELLFVEDEQTDFYETIFERPVNRPDPEKGAYKNYGGLSHSLRKAFPQADFRYVLQEFGTYPATKTLRALRRENFFWNRRNGPYFPKEKIAAEMLEAFCPESAEWRKTVLNLGRHRFHQALTALA